MWLQSGSDSVLGRLKRRYALSDYQDKMSLIKSLVPNAAVTTDIIVGFPGETDAEFEESYNFCRQAGFARIHVFPYSPRQETEAAHMANKVTSGVKKARCQKMLSLAFDSARGFQKQFLGKDLAVLWEKQTDGIWSGYTDNYIKVYARGTADLTNQLVSARLVKPWNDGVWGQIVG